MGKGAEERFKLVVLVVIKRGQYPSPRRICKILYPDRGHVDNLSGRECRWRREVCKKAKFKLRGKNL